MKAVVLAAGDGTRMRPLTAYTPKPLLLVAGKPFLHHCLISLRDAGIREAVLVVGWRQDRIRASLGDGSALGMKVSYVEQSQRLGTAHAVGMARNLMDDSFLCLNGDVILSSSTVKRMMEIFKASGRSVMALSEVRDPRGYGVVLVDGDRVTRILEKPRDPPSNLVNAGVYAFKREVFDTIQATPTSARGEYEITDTLMMLVEKEGVMAHVMEEPWLDVGRPWDLLDANETLMDRMEGDVRGTVEEGVHMEGKVVVDEGARVRSGSYIVGPVHIGSGSQVGPHTFIRGRTTIGRNCHIGAFVEVKNTIVMDNSNVPHHNYVGDSIIGSNCNLGSGTKVANLRLDNRNIMLPVKGKMVDTGRRKIGVIMGDNVKVGINATINAGTIVGEDTFIGPGATASGNIAPRSRVH